MFCGFKVIRLTYKHHLDLQTPVCENLFCIEFIEERATISLCFLYHGINAFSITVDNIPLYRCIVIKCIMGVSFFKVDRIYILYILFGSVLSNNNILFHT